MSCSQEKGVRLIDIVGRDKVESRVVVKAREGSCQRLALKCCQSMPVLRLIVSQTQVDFKAGEYVNPAYSLIIQGRVTKATLQEAEAWEIME